MSATLPAARALAPRWRAARIVASGGASLFLATAAHTLGGGTLPAPGLLAVVGLLLGLIAVPLTMRRCRLPVLIGVLALEQLAVHAVLGAAAAPLDCLPRATHHAVSTCAGSLPAADHSMAQSSWPMVLAHLVAVLATAWLLARGEAWLWRAADRVNAATGPRSLRLRSRVVLPILGRRHPAAGRRAAAPLPARGPPVLV